MLGWRAGGLSLASVVPSSPFFRCSGTGNGRASKRELGGKRIGYNKGLHGREKTTFPHACGLQHAAMWGFLLFSVARRFVETRCSAALRAWCLPCALREHKQWRGVVWCGRRVWCCHYFALILEGFQPASCFDSGTHFDLINEASADFRSPRPAGRLHRRVDPNIQRIAACSCRHTNVLLSSLIVSDPSLS
ncbi:hypothetical protein BS78_07G168500 [Paspalum vaginatum]|nr:hypothetical protein BS78_07G168500 [Paspalum vaginatum]